MTTPKNPYVTNTNGELADLALKAKAAMADAENTLAKIKDEFISRGVDETEGKLGRVTLSQYDYDTRDEKFKAKIEELVAQHVSPQFAAAHTEHKTTCRMSVKARIGATESEAA